MHVPFDLEVRRTIVPKGVAEAAEGSPHFGRDHLRVDSIIGLQRSVRAMDFPAGGKRPDQLVVAEVPGHPDREQKGVPSRVEVRRLPLVGLGGLKGV